MISVQGVNLSLGGHPILHDIDLTVPTGQVLGLVGPNGSGKTSLMRLLFGGLRPEAGIVTLGGRDLKRISRREVARHIAVVAQERPENLEQTVADLVSLGRLPLRGWFSSLQQEDDVAVCAALDRVGLLDFAARRVQDLSGGERQRALVARALAQETGCLLLDEPTNHLDLRSQLDLLGLIRALGRTTVLVLHDLNLAARYCDRIALLEKGKIVAYGAVKDVLSPEKVSTVYHVKAVPLKTPNGDHHLYFDQLNGQYTYDVIANDIDTKTDRWFRAS